jgi:transcriptional regulator with GAF, ATPase, and Fis domain
VDRWALVCHLVDVALAEDPASTADRLLSAVLTFTNARRAAIFEVQFEHLRLFASRGIDEAVLAEAEEAWRTRRDALLAGSPVLTERCIAQPLVEERTLGVLMVERTDSTSFEDARDRRALEELARLGAKALRQRRAEPSTYLASTNPEDVARDQLLVLLESNEWNIARVARLMGVTRPTIYARLQRFGLPRRRQLIGKRQPG